MVGLHAALNKPAKPTHKRTTKPRKHKYVGFLSNHTDRRDDERISVWAYSKEEAEVMLHKKTNTARFSLDYVMTAKDAARNWA